MVLLKECASNVLDKSYSGPCKVHYEIPLSYCSIQRFGIGGSYLNVLLE